MPRVPRISKKRRAELVRITEEYRRNRTFPGVAACLDMLYAGGDLLEWGVSLLRSAARDYVAELIAAFEAPEHCSIRWLLLEAMGATRSSAAVPLLVACLHNDESNLWSWAIRALREIDTKESRRALWEAQFITFAIEQETARFQEVLAHVLNEWHSRSSSPQPRSTP